MQDIAQVRRHHRLLAGREEAAEIEFGFEIVEHRQDHLAPGWRRGVVLAKGRLSMARLEPFIAVEQHGLGKVQRGEGGIDREGQDRVGQADLLVGEADALAPVEDTHALAGTDAARDLGHGLGRGENALHLAALAGGRCQDVVEVGDRLGRAIEQPGILQDMGGAGGRRGRTLLEAAAARPAVARGNEAHLGEAEIRHGAGAHADILGELGLDQDDDGGRGLDGRAGAVGAGTGHGKSDLVFAVMLHSAPDGWAR
jgi:hypothetical protein